MSRRTQRNSRRNKKEAAKLQKAATTTEQRQSKRQISSAAIEAVRKVVEILKPFELSRSQRNKTFASMMLDDCVFSGFDSRATAIQLSQAAGKFRYKKDSAASLELKKFLEYNMKKLNGQTPRSIGRSCAEMIIFGYAPHEVSYQKIEGEYANDWILNKVSYVHPLSLDEAKPVQISSNGDRIEYLRQGATAFQGTDGVYGGVRSPWMGVKEIDYRRVAMCSYSATSSQPFGNSPLEAAYTLWREKQLLQDYLLVGVTRDFSGTPVLRLPSEVLEAAEADPNSQEAQQVANLAQGMQEMHSGDAAFMILPSDAQNEQGTGTLRDFEIQFLGIEGSAKNFNITEILEQKKRGIHMVLTTQHLLAGESGGSSYNLHEGQVATSALAAKNDNLIIDEMWNKVIFPKLLRLNNIDYLEEDIPVWEHGEAQPISHDEYGKFVNRVARLLPATPDVCNAILKRMEIDYRVPEDASPDDIRAMMFEFQDPSKTGTGEGSSGQGSSSQKNSDNNAENAS
ncbi:hypothetical protein [Vibrio phage RYC]|nr:hypothetical protein [Vibrio phage RYC]